METSNLTTQEARKGLPERNEPYWSILEYCRHLGFERRQGRPRTWVARVRNIDGGYKQKRLGLSEESDDHGLSYSAALKAARTWFATPAIQAVASRSYEVGSTPTLRYTSSGRTFTVGDALIDYVAWKRIAATQKTFYVLLSLINFHILPRLGDLPLERLTGKVMTAFCRDVLETPPKRGNQPMRPKVALSELNADALRRRKATVNTLVGILRLSVRMAWENGNTESERAWRCIHRLPNYEAPRQHFLTRPQCRTLLEACRPDLADLVRGALYTGCRIAELSELRRRDVAKDIFGIHVSPSKSRRARYVYLPDEGMRFFLSASSEKHDDDHVFRTQSGQAWDGRHKHLFRAAVLAAGLPPNFVFHGLRHTYASQLVQAGAPLALVARQLGHANTDTVSRTYGHLSCTSIERELRLRFATLEERQDDPGPDLSYLRASLQANEPPNVHPSWPLSNFATFDGDLLGALKGR